MDICHVGDFVFDLKPKDELSREANREIAKVDIPGASPIYQDMGKGECTYSWSGVLRGDDALVQSIAIEAEMNKGTIVNFGYGAIFASVRIRKFSPQIKRFDYIKYSIELVEDMPDEDAEKNVKATVINVDKAIAQKNSNSVLVKQGEDLLAIAYKTNMSWQDIAKYNNIINPRKIPTGTTLNLPK